MPRNASLNVFFKQFQQSITVGLKKGTE